MAQETEVVMLVGYVRVSTEEQNTQRQTELLESLGCTKIFIDTASGKDRRRVELERLMDFVREGDIVVVESISRFARNARDFLNLTCRLEEKSVDFISQKESIDTSTPTGKFMMTVFAAVAELEREYTLGRQREGIEIAKRLGKYKGRKPLSFPDFDKYYRMVQHGEMKVSEAQRRLGITPTTWYRRVRVLKRYDQTPSL
jgi:DNA invertase Pin-like site-specific DNA recombinase